MVATKDADGWLKGQYGLVRINDPDFVWSGELMLNPWFQLSDAEIDSLPPGDRRISDFDRYVDMIDEIEPSFEVGPMYGYWLVSACIEDGYDSKLHGKRVVFWLIHHIAEKLSKEK
ncbi:MAG TPA: hypothetical protein VHM28_05185 [Anaerolineales bacterium]|nr:hypothetical protein [Anaerolineales bacterium]